MRLLNVSSTPHNGCISVSIGSTNILFEAGADVSDICRCAPKTLSCKFTQDWYHIPTRNGVVTSIISKEKFRSGRPRIRTPTFDAIDLSTIHCIFLSNHESFGALPFITERSEFKGRIFATKPTLECGRLLLRSRAKLMGPPWMRIGTHEYNKQRSSTFLTRLHEKLENRGNSETPPSDLLPLFRGQLQAVYSEDEVETSLAKVEVVNFGEDLEVAPNVIFMPCSSGYSIGSCCWILKLDDYRMGFIGSCNTTQRHPRPLEIDLLKQCDELCIYNLSTCDQSAEKAWDEVTHKMVETLTKGENVIFPMDPCGLVYDFLENIYRVMNKSDLSGVPIYFISPVAKEAIAYSSIFSEWLNTPYQMKVNQGNYPFSFQSLVENQRLHAIPAISTSFWKDKFRKPCIMLLQTPSLRFGPILDFINQYDHSFNTMILTDPRFPKSLALSAFPDLKMNVEYIPIDLRLKMEDLKKLVRAVVPYHIHIPDYVNCNIPNKTVHGYLQPAEFGRNLKYVKGYVRGPTKKLRPQIVNPSSKYMVSTFDTSLRFRQYNAILEEHELKELELKEESESEV